jgi:hypothetical protein
MLRTFAATTGHLEEEHIQPIRNLEKVKTDVGGHAQIFFMSAIAALQLEVALTQLNICNFLK